jgi:hypothetical protein
MKIIIDFIALIALFCLAFFGFRKDTPSSETLPSPAEKEAEKPPITDMTDTSDYTIVETDLIDGIFYAWDGITKSFVGQALSVDDIAKVILGKYPNQKIKVVQR